MTWLCGICLICLAGGCYWLRPNEETEQGQPVPAHPQRNEHFDPASLIGMEWGKATRVIRENGWLCELFGGESAKVPLDIDYGRLSPTQRLASGSMCLWITLQGGTVVGAQVVGEL
jgi:hypothetical protein